MLYALFSTGTYCVKFRHHALFLSNLKNVMLFEYILKNPFINNWVTVYSFVSITLLLWKIEIDSKKEKREKVRSMIVKHTILNNYF